LLSKRHLRHQNGSYQTADIGTELAKDIKTEADLNPLSREFLKLTAETALSAELTEQLGYGTRLQLTP
jgi:transposase-like protein